MRLLPLEWLFVLLLLVHFSTLPHHRHTNTTVVILLTFDAPCPLSSGRRRNKAAAMTISAVAAPKAIQFLIGNVALAFVYYVSSNSSFKWLLASSRSSPLSSARKVLCAPLWVSLVCPSCSGDCWSSRCLFRCLSGSNGSRRRWSQYGDVDGGSSYIRRNLLKCLGANGVYHLRPFDCRIRSSIVWECAQRTTDLLHASVGVPIRLAHIYFVERGNAV